MDLVRELMEAFEQADIDKMKIEMEGVKLELEKSQQVQVTALKVVQFLFERGVLSLWAQRKRPPYDNV